MIRYKLPICNIGSVKSKDIPVGGSHKIDHSARRKEYVPKKGSCPKIWDLMEEPQDSGGSHM